MGATCSSPSIGPHPHRPPTKVSPTSPLNKLPSVSASVDHLLSGAMRAPANGLLHQRVHGSQTDDFINKNLVTDAMNGFVASKVFRFEKRLTNLNQFSRFNGLTPRDESTKTTTCLNDNHNSFPLNVPDNLAAHPNYPQSHAEPNQNLEMVDLKSAKLAVSATLLGATDKRESPAPISLPSHITSNTASSPHPHGTFSSSSWSSGVNKIVTASPPCKSRKRDHRSSETSSPRACTPVVDSRLGGVDQSTSPSHHPLVSFPSSPLPPLVSCKSEAISKPELCRANTFPRYRMRDPATEFLRLVGVPAPVLSQ